MTARSVACPTPVNAKLPCSEARTPENLNGDARIMSRNREAATIGPIVWEDDGPIPTLNMSKTETNISGATLLKSVHVSRSDR